MDKVLFNGLIKWLSTSVNSKKTSVMAMVNTPTTTAAVLSKATGKKISSMDSDMSLETLTTTSRKVCGIRAP